MNYIEKKAIANAYLEKQAGITWEDYSDKDTLDICHEEEDIIAACEQLLKDNGFSKIDTELLDNLVDDDDEIGDRDSDDYINYDYLD